MAIIIHLTIYANHKVSGNVFLVNFWFENQKISNGVFLKLKQVLKLNETMKYYKPIVVFVVK